MYDLSRIEIYEVLSIIHEQEQSMDWEESKVVRIITKPCQMPNFLIELFFTTVLDDFY